MVKASLLMMAVLTVLIAMGLRWREQRMPEVAKAKGLRAGLLARGKKGLDRWVTAAALAAAVTLVVLGGLHWLKVWQG